MMLDVLSLAELQRLGVPHTDDGLKYQYRLEQDQYVMSDWVSLSLIGSHWVPPALVTHLI